MKVNLLQESNAIKTKESVINHNEVIQDFNLDIILKFMAREDRYIYKVSRNIITAPLTDNQTILLRQGIITDCIKHYDNFYKIYEMTGQTIEVMDRLTEGAKRANSSNQSNAAIALGSLEMLGVLVDNLEDLKEYLDKIESDFSSNGMRSFYNKFCEEYHYDFVLAVKDSVQNLNFLTEGGEITFSAVIGQGLKTQDIVINHLRKEELYRWKDYFSLLMNRVFRRNIIMLDNSRLEQDARDLESAGIAHIMKLYQSFIRELLSFFESLHYQMAFYIGAANLHNRLTQLHIPTSMPQLQIKNIDDFKFRGLYDLSLACYNREKPVSNDLETLDMKLFIITGANQGGKSTYLRSIGIAQLMMQCGMFVPAKYYCSKLFKGIFSHFTRREDTAMNSGKLDEELARMNRILSSVTPDSLLLMNESFATTTEREGSKIAQDVVHALYENGTKIIMVTHLFEFTKAMFEKKLEHSIFLSAERLADGTRTFRIYEREPERTSYGLDLYNDIVKQQ